MKVYSIIVTYNGIKWIKKCLDSLRNSTIVTSIIVIDNCSTDGTVDFIESNYPEINLIRSPQNLGFGRSNNIGIKIAFDNNADYFFLLNQDAWVEADTIEKLISVHNKNEGYEIISPIHLDGSGKELDLKFAVHLSRYKPKVLLGDFILNRTPKEIYETDFVNAAAWLISRKCISIIGGFSSVFFHYGEDDNYCHRLKFHGFKIGISPLSVIYHDRPQFFSNKYFDDFLIAKRIKAKKLCNPNRNIRIKNILMSELLVIRGAFKCLPPHKAILEILKSFIQNHELLNQRKITMKKGLHYLD